MMNCRLTSKQPIPFGDADHYRDPDEVAIQHEGTLWLPPCNEQCSEVEKPESNWISPDGELCVVNVQVIELERDIFFEMGTSWSGWLDAWDHDLWLLGKYLDKRDEGIDGSILYVKELHVHPNFRGKKLGLALLSNVLNRLSRSCEDLAVLFANQIPSRYESGDGKEEHDNSPDALSKYYRQAGFRVRRCGRQYGARLMTCNVWDELNLVRPHPPNTKYPRCHRSGIAPSSPDPLACCDLF